MLPSDRQRVVHTRPIRQQADRAGVAVVKRWHCREDVRHEARACGDGVLALRERGGGAADAQAGQAGEDSPGR